MFVSLKKNYNITDTEKIKIIDSCPSPLDYHQDDLPENFKLKTLGVEYYNEIHKLLTNHYVEDQNKITRLTYSKDFIYWYLKYIPSEYIIGLVYKKKIVGIITIMIIDMIIYDTKIKMPYIDLLCVQTRVRNMGLANFLTNEAKRRIAHSKFPYGISTGLKSKCDINSGSVFCKTQDYVIPINYKKLKKIGFLMDDLDLVPIINDNPLHLMTDRDLAVVIAKLHKHMNQLCIKPYFTLESAKHFLLPKKNIIYSYVLRDEYNQITDFVSVYINYLYCIDINQFISVAQLAFYFYESLNISQLITFLIDKLSKQKIDQLIFRNMFDNMNINITKFSTKGDLHYIFHNVEINEIKSSDLIFFPF